MESGFELLVMQAASSFLKIYFVDYTITVVPFFLPFIPLYPVLPLPPSFPHLSSCQWVVHINSLAFPFPILFLTSPCLLCTYHFCLLFPVPFPAFFPLRLSLENPLCDLHFCDSVPVLVVRLVMFFSGSVVDSCEFVVILLFILLMFFFLLEKSL